MKRKKYIAPQTDVSEVELESGFMADSVYKDPENTKGLTIQNQQVQDTGKSFDFSDTDTWTN